MLPLLASPLGVACGLCLPCTTPPCYKQDSDYTYSSNGPGNWYGSVSPCWYQRAESPHLLPANVGGRQGEECPCPADWTETQILPTFVDKLDRQMYGEFKYRHRHTADQP